MSRYDDTIFFIARQPVPYSLDLCLQHFFQERQPTPHTALTDAECVRKISERGADELGFPSVLHYLQAYEHRYKSILDA